MSERINIPRCRKLLGSHATGLPDEQITAIRDQIYELATVVVDAYSDTRNEVDFDLESINPDPETWRAIVQHFWDRGWDIEGGQEDSWRYLIGEDE